MDEPISWGLTAARPVCALPLYYIFAFTVGMMLALRSGGKLILIPNPRDMVAVLAEWPAGLCVVPTRRERGGRRGLIRFAF